MGTASLETTQAPSQRGWPILLVHQSVALWGPTYLAPAMVILLSEVGWHFGIRTNLPQGQWILYGSPFFPAQVGLALLVGWIVGGTLPHRAMPWVWAIPLVALCLAFVGTQLLPAPSPTSVMFPPIEEVSITWVLQLPFASRLSRFFCRPGAGLEPYIQVIATLPVYSAAAYSLGAWLARNVVQVPAFFDAMRNLRMGRLLLFVALPWLCLKLALNWQWASAQYPVLGTWPVLRALLVMLTMGAVLVASVFALAVALVGRRFSLTRFFLNPDGRV